MKKQNETNNFDAFIENLGGYVSFDVRLPILDGSRIALRAGFHFPIDWG